jgi:hypothetical protein
VQVAVRQKEPLCKGCLEANILSKVPILFATSRQAPSGYNFVAVQVRAAIKVKGVVQPGDRILVPVSGGMPAAVRVQTAAGLMVRDTGPASLALVHLLLSLQNANRERLERGKVRPAAGVSL